MTEHANQYTPDHVSSPGATLLDLLEERGLTQAELAIRMGRPKKTINEIVQGKAAITPETSLQLELVLGVPAQFWLTREQQYQEFVARRQEKQRLIADAGWLDELPLGALVKRGVLTRTADPAFQMSQALGFFGVASVPQYREVYTSPQAKFRQSSEFEVDAGSVAAWLRMGEIEAAEVPCGPFAAPTFREALAELRGLAQLTDPRLLVTRLRDRCAAAGVAVVFIPEIAGCGASGATFWLGSQKAVIQLSRRATTNDRLWFTFLHEAAHLLLHGKREVFLEGKPGHGKEEEEANTFARDLLIPALAYGRLLRSGPHTAEGIVQFAAEIGTHPAIVLGRLQHDNLVPQEAFLHLRANFQLDDP